MVPDELPVCEADPLLVGDPDGVAVPDTVVLSEPERVPVAAADDDPLVDGVTLGVSSWLGVCVLPTLTT